MPPAKVKRLDAIVPRYPGLTIVDDMYLVITCAQARQFLDFITRELAKVFARVRQQFPAVP